MKSMNVTLDMITPGLCGGADPASQAEIRPPSIRGQLRWWFRTLGGFVSLLPLDVRGQEEKIFGSIAGDTGRAGSLQVRVRLITESKPVKKDLDKLSIRLNSPSGYLLFPLRSTKNRKTGADDYKGRMLFHSNILPSFDLHVSWRDDDIAEDDITALVTVFSSLGALGSRSRRGFGALAFPPNAQPPMTLGDSLGRFRKPEGIIIREHSAICNSPDQAIDSLGEWLKGWRRYKYEDNQPKGLGYTYAKNDHDISCGTKQDDVTYRPSLGLPIISKYGEWNESWNKEKNKGEGRFASPVILRPYRLPDGRYKALVIFAEARKWPEDKKVYLSGIGERRVSLALYEAMKSDHNLRPFGG